MASINMVVGVGAHQLATQWKRAKVKIKGME